MNQIARFSGRTVLRFLSLVTLFSVLAVSCAGAEPAGKINAADTKALLASNPLAVLLDVRTKEEFDSGYIKGAKLLPFDLITAESAATFAPNKAEPVVVYCRSGRRSGVAAETLKALGYQKVYDLGGVGNWTFGLEK